MTRFGALTLQVEMLLRTYPALSAALLNIGVALLAYFGFHVTAPQLAGIVSVITAIFGVLVHANVIPVVKAKPPAGLGPVSPVNSEPSK